MSHKDIIELYKGGIREAKRVLRPGGMLWVKCKDEIEGGHQRWSHVEIYNAATDLGFYGLDLFVLVTQVPCGLRWRNGQRHARKNHSYLWVLRSTTSARGLASA
jgi:hypothetical protein